MSYNPRYLGPSGTPYDTFQYPSPQGFHNFPPPPLPPMNFQPRPPLSDKDYIAQWDRRLLNTIQPKRKKQVTLISEARGKLKRMISLIDGIKAREKYLTENYTSLSNEQWQETLAVLNSERTNLDITMLEMNGSYINELQHNLEKRSAKRLRLKMVKCRKAEEKKQTLKDREEKSRKIDESLQKMKNDLEKIKKMEEDKLEADIILRDVFRKKHDAKKCIEKLEALIKLRRARGNTARGRGENVSETEANTFNKSIERLIEMWKDNLVSYEGEERELRRRLAKTPEEPESSSAGTEAAQVQAAWRAAMFGAADATPQRDFKGNLQHFIDVRHKWDAFISEEGSVIPVGWLLPQETSLE